MEQNNTDGTPTDETERDIWFTLVADGRGIPISDRDTASEDREQFNTFVRS